VADRAWEHLRGGSFEDAHRELVENARLFTEVTTGAMLLYNYQLALLREKPGQKALVKEHLDSRDIWASSLPIRAIREWDLGRFWELVMGQGRVADYRTRRFVETWISLVKTGHRDLFRSEEARALVKAREMAVKKGRSRFSSPSSLEQWSGHSGLREYVYRWPTVKDLINDLVQAKGRARNAKPK
jgi:hypothetical protein